MGKGEGQADASSEESALHRVYSSSDAEAEVLLQHSHVDAPYEDTRHKMPAVDRKIFPDFEKARWYEAIVMPGDTLFIPARFWHWVFSEDQSVAVQFFHNPSDSASASRFIDNGTGSPSRDVDVVENITSRNSQEVFSNIADHRTESQPLLLKGSASHWPAQRWDCWSLLEAEDACIQRYTVSSGHSLCPLEKPHPCYADTGVSRRGTSKDLLGELRDEANRDLQFQWVIPLTPSSASLLQDIRMPHTVDPKSVSNINVWSNRGAVHTGLHYDMQDNMLVAVKGRKRVLLYPQSETPHLYHLPFPRSAIKAWSG